jgi:diaminopimelate epimerase
LADERGYIVDGIVRSGGKDYPVERAEDIAEGIATYAVDIPISTSSDDFAFFGSDERWLGKVIESFDEELKFSALSLGNPHIVACVERVDLKKLEALGEAVKERRDLFPNGVNISLYERRSEHEIFVATYERGAGITLSCGTAMTASATAAALLGIVEAGKRIEVKNRGGKVACRTTIGGEITTRLEGNATFEWWGRASFEGGELKFEKLNVTGEEERWQAFRQKIAEE